MIIEACGASHTGNLRKHNEDNIYVDGTYRRDLSFENILIKSRRTSGPYTYAVFDGLGGEESGEQASLIAAIGLRAMEDRGVAGDTDTYITTTHQAILQEAEKKRAGNMGTTAVLVHIDGDRATVSNVGDSRAYLLRGGRLQQLSKDHNVYQSIMDAGIKIEDGKRREKSKSELTQYIGMPSDEDVEPSAFTADVGLLEGDMLLLCSDGLTGELSDDEIRDILCNDQNSSAEYLTARLVKAAVDRVGKDNISAIVCIVR